MSDDRTAFISYRRSSGASEARVVQAYLEAEGIDAFLDVDGLDSGHFDSQLLEHIAARKHFLLICTPGALDRCHDSEDWLRREIAHAIASGRNIVPIQLPGFVWPIAAALPRDIASIVRYNAFTYDHATWKATRKRLLGMIGGLRTPGKGSSEGLSPSDREKVAVARGLVAEVKRYSDRGSVARRAALRCLLDRTGELPIAHGARHDLVCLRVDAALELDDAAIGPAIVAELLEPSLREGRSDRQIQLLAQAEARGWIASDLPSMADYFDLQVATSAVEGDVGDDSFGSGLEIDSEFDEAADDSASVVVEAEAAHFTFQPAFTAAAAAGTFRSRVIGFLFGWLRRLSALRSPAAGVVSTSLNGNLHHPALLERRDLGWVVLHPKQGQSDEVPAEDMQAWLDSGQATGDESVWRADWTQWRSIREVFPDVFS